MNRLSKSALMSALAGLLLLLSVTVARADDPSFKSGKDKDTKEFATKVFETIIKGTRTSPKDITLTKYAYTAVKDKKTRKLLILDGTFKGSVTKKKFTEKWTLTIDVADEKEWEVVKMEFQTDHPTTKPSLKNIQAVTKKLNK